MKWIDGTNQDGDDTNRIVTTCDDVREHLVPGRFVIDMWREEQTAWRRDHGIQDV